MANTTRTGGANVAQPLIDNPAAPEIFADALRGAVLVNGNVHMSLTSFRADHGKVPTRYYQIVIARLVMPLDQAEVLARELANFVAQMKAQENAPADTPRTLQ